MKLDINEDMFVDVNKNSFILKRGRVVQKGKAKGTVRAETLGYFSTLRDVFAHILKMDTMVETRFINTIEVHNKILNKIESRLMSVEVLPRYVKGLEEKVERLEKEIALWQIEAWKNPNESST